MRQSFRSDCRPPSAFLPATYNGRMIRARRLAVLGGALLWLAVGVAQFAFQSAKAPRSPAWAAELAPLVEAPLTPGTAVALLEPVVAPSVDIEPLLMEAAWQRPDLRWGFFGDFPKARPADALVALGAAPPPAGWHEVWRRGVVTVFRREAR
jgi:hypothetical protein